MEPLARRVASLNFSLSGAQTVIGLTAGIVSILGALIAVPGYFGSAPGKGQLVTVIRDAKTDQSVTDATVEIMTAQDTLITTLTPNFLGKAKHSLEEGQYRVRVSHPKFSAELRQVQVLSGETTEVKVRLRERLLDEGIGAIRRIFRK